jgi:glutathione peroxidase
MPSLSDFTVRSIDGADQPLSAYAGHVVLIVNTASQCGFTPQYAGLERLWQDHRDEGFAVLGFPCNQFGGQEPGSEDEIAAFCETSFGVTFPMFAKVDVNGSAADPLFSWLKEEKGGLLGDRIKWNFTKFLVGRDGQVLGRYSSRTDPADIASDIEAALRA